MRKAISLLLVIALLVMCAACQPTPEEDFVIQKDGDLIEEKIGAGNPASLEQTPEPEAAISYKEYVEAYKASLPQHWNEEFGDFSVDTDIVVSNESSFPVYTITHGEFDMGKMEVMANRFFHNITGLASGTRLSQDEYAAAITYLNEQGRIETAEILIGEMQGAPTVDYTDADCITLAETGSQKYKVRLADGSVGEVYFTPGFGDGAYMFLDSCRYSIIHVQRDLEMDGSYVGEGPVILEPAITQEQGEEMMNAFMQENELEGFTVASVTAARHFEILPQREISQGWQFTLMRTYGYQAINTTDTSEGSGWLTYEDDNAYSRPWRRETVIVYVSENGVEFFSWEYPMEVTEIAAENVELLDFEQVWNNMRKLLQASVDYTPGHWRGEITQIILTVVPQQATDDSNKAYLMPVWVASIDWYCVYNDGTISSQCDAYSLFGINALDGSRAIMQKEEW